jgi:hypothetical protein
VLLALGELDQGSIERAAPGAAGAERHLRVLALMDEALTGELLGPRDIGGRGKRRGRDDRRWRGISQKARAIEWGHAVNGT